MKRIPLIVRVAIAAVTITAAALVQAGGSHARAGSLLQTECVACTAAAGTISVDPSSYKLWPDGNRTFLNVQWSTDAGAATFIVSNTSSALSAAHNAIVEISDHDPASELPRDHTAQTYQVPPLAPDTSTTITVPLDPTQCDIWVTVDLGTGDPLVLRTGNPATC